MTAARAYRSALDFAPPGVCRARMVHSAMSHVGSRWIRRETAVT
jgi:hypothetical protein